MKISDAEIMKEIYKGHDICTIELDNRTVRLQCYERARYFITLFLSLFE